jgi:L-lactate dehydrogenase complex protein LldG
MTTREEALTRIRQSLQTGTLPVAAFDRKPTTGAGAIDRATLITAFAHEAQASGGEVLQPPSHAEAIETVVQLIKDVDQRVLAWPSGELPLAGIDAALQSAGIRRVTALLPHDTAARRAHWADLDPIKVGLTGALAGLADTGSIGLSSGPQRSRAASLLPETHIALLPTDCLYPSLSDFFAAHSPQELTAASSNQVFITGPSRTADIEMIITRGVHGPKRLCVVLLPQ